MLWEWGWCVYIGCHSGKCGDVNVLMTEKVHVQPTKEETVSGCYNLQMKQHNYPIITISTIANLPCF
jgi:xanthine dehydrogenase iron-sulfur cluster and FAD-binding subunit A